jgi:DNA polymerase (family 10)
MRAAEIARRPQAARAAFIFAVANPFVTILGHMTGRQLLRRVGYEVDVGKVLKACADHGIAVEINANRRLDLDWRWHHAGWSWDASSASTPTPIRSPSST